MDVEDYRAARRTRLVELATGLGVPAGEAEQVVDRVIEAQARRIRRSEDPDEVVVPALREEVLGPRSRGASTAILAFAAVVLAAFGVAFALTLVPTDDDPPDGPDERTATVPSLLGLTADEAAAVLERERIALRVRSVPQCNPAGQVLGSVPPMGTSVGSDDVVTVIATSDPTWVCPDDEGARATAWGLLRAVVSGSARPDLAPAVRLYVDGDQVGVTSGTEPTTSPEWRSVVRDPVARYVSRPVVNDLGQPVVSVTRGVPPATTCGRPSAMPAEVEAVSTRLVLTAGGAEGGCELTIDLFEDASGAVSALALTTPDLGTGAPPGVDPAR